MIKDMHEGYINFSIGFSIELEEASIAELKKKAINLLEKSSLSKLKDFNFKTEYIIIDNESN